jgi:hypothetical protein
MPDSYRVAKFARIFGIVRSVGVAILLVLAEFGVWMAGANLHPTPRINAFTVGMGLVSVPAITWIIYLWTRKRPAGIADFIVRTIVTGLLLYGAYICFGLALFGALFVG